MRPTILTVLGILITFFGCILCFLSVIMALTYPWKTYGTDIVGIAFLIYGISLLMRS